MNHPSKGTQADNLTVTRKNSIYLYAVGSPSEDFDGSAKVDFTVDGVSSSGEGNFSQPRSVGSRNDSLSSLKAGVILAAEEAGNGDASFNVTFYHCIAGNFWTNSPDSDTTIFDDEGGDESSANSCALCTEMAEGDVEVAWVLTLNDGRGECCLAEKSDLNSCAELIVRVSQGKF